MIMRKKVDGDVLPTSLQDKKVAPGEETEETEAGNPGEETETEGTP